MANLIFFFTAGTYLYVNENYFYLHLVILGSYLNHAVNVMRCKFMRVV